ncbi:hypothetical protein OG432_24660 [Streptomyces sp. NBC_00442]|uniref:hypothetical protein n=1 Tax=Streptomyces sp. NBC_00442 TaxID=2903651 RepID=UPI002E1D5A2C
MSTENITIPPEAARHVLWHYGRVGGQQPGTFTQHLMAAIESADVINRATLRGAYPALSAALHMARYDEEGLSKLLAAATQPHCADCGDTDGPFAERVEGYVCEPCTKKRAL